jgi:cystathionine beta-synthase
MKVTEAPKAPRFAEPLESVLDCIAWTPLIRLRRVAHGVRMPVYAKAEQLNPGHSVKDRIGLAMIEAAERDGSLKPGGTIVEATGGNTGVALAMVAAIKGYRCVFTMPDKMSMEKVRLLRAYGAQVIITPTAVPPDSPEHYINAAKKIAKETPGAVLTNQFYNPVNVDCHYQTTGPEIWAQTNGRVRAFVVGAGTGGTVSGAGKYLKEMSERVRVVLADPVGSVYKQYQETGKVGKGTPYMVEGIGGDKIPDIMDFGVIDEVRQVTDKESLTMTRRLAREEGLLVGGSTGTLAAVAVQVAREIDDPEGCVVTLLCDTGERYLSKAHDDEWMRQNRLLEADAVLVRVLLERKRAGTPGLVHVPGATTVRKALDLMQQHAVTQLPVIEEGESLGSLSETRLMARALQDMKILEAPVQAVMEPPFPVVHARDTVEHVTQLLGRGNDAVLVRDAGAFTGILTRSDVLDALRG